MSNMLKIYRSSYNEGNCADSLNLFSHKLNNCLKTLK